MVQETTLVCVETSVDDEDKAWLDWWLGCEGRWRFDVIYSIFQFSSAVFVCSHSKLVRLAEVMLRDIVAEKTEIAGGFPPILDPLEPWVDICLAATAPKWACFIEVN